MGVIIMTRPEMLDIFKPNGVDWLHVNKTKHNIYTFHHIHKASKGGKASINNGAILTLYPHGWLNIIETLNKSGREEYRELNKLFLELNKTMAPPCPGYWQEVDGILLYYAERTIDLGQYVRRRTR